MDASATWNWATATCCCSSTRTPEQWYLAYGGDMADYVDNDPSILFRQNPRQPLYRQRGKERDGALSGPARLVCGKHSGSERQCRPAGTGVCTERRKRYDLFEFDHDSRDCDSFKIIFARGGATITTASTTAEDPDPASGAACSGARCSVATATSSASSGDRDRGIACPPQDPDPAVFTQDRAAPASSPAREALAAGSRGGGFGGRGGGFGGGSRGGGFGGGRR